MFRVGVVLLVLLCLVGVHALNLDLCAAESDPDPCLPGGKFDPLLGKCTGYREKDCFACFTGSTCKSVNPGCTIELTSGDPMLLQEYWETQNHCSATPTDYRMNYQAQAAEQPIRPLEDAIRAIHKQINNAVVDDYEIVIGYGATQVLEAAVTAMAELGTFDEYNLLVQPPHWNKYPLLTASMMPSRRLADKSHVYINWNTTANPASPNTIEILIYPNNPDGSLRAPLVSDKSRLIYDAVYYWPQFGPLRGPIQGDIMVFSSTKHTGHAGTRLGWGLVKDKTIAQTMRNFVILKTNGVSIDAQLRALAAMQVVLNDATSLPALYTMGAEMMNNRWTRLINIFNQGTHPFTLLNAVDKGSFIWVDCPVGYNCQAVFRAVGLEGSDGTGFGATSRQVRFNFIGRSVEVDVLLERFAQRLYELPLEQGEAYEKLLQLPKINAPMN